MSLTRHPRWWGLATQESLCFAVHKIGTGIIFGRLYGRGLVCSRSGAALRLALEVHTHFALLLIESQKEIDNQSDEEHSKNPSHDPGFWHTVCSCLKVVRSLSGRGLERG